MRVVVMGVAGSGKSTVGELLASRIGVVYADADEFHPAANVAKMSAGAALADEDRWPWLAAVAHWLVAHEVEGAVVSCSALKRSYREVLRADGPDIWFLHLDGPRALMTERVAGRPHHFMPADLVASQFEILEPLQADESGIVLDAGADPEQIIDNFLRVANLRS